MLLLLLFSSPVVENGNKDYGDDICANTALFSTKVFEIMLIGIINKVDKTSVIVNILQAVQVNACL